MVPYFSLAESRSDVWTPGLDSSLRMGGQNSFFEPLWTKAVTVSLLEVAEISEEKEEQRNGASLSIPPHRGVKPVAWAQHTVREPGSGRGEHGSSS